MDNDIDTTQIEADLAEIERLISVQASWENGAWYIVAHAPKHLRYLLSMTRLLQHHVAEAESHLRCETCGGPFEVRGDRGWDVDTNRPAWAPLCRRCDAAEQEA